MTHHCKHQYKLSREESKQDSHSSRIQLWKEMACCISSKTDLQERTSALVIGEADLQEKALQIDSQKRTLVIDKLNKLCTMLGINLPATSEEIVLLYLIQMFRVPQNSL